MFRVWGLRMREWGLGITRYYDEEACRIKLQSQSFRNSEEVEKPFTTTGGGDASSIINEISDSKSYFCY